MKQHISSGQSQSAFHKLLLAEISTLISFAKRFSMEVEDLNDLVQDTIIKALRYSNKFKNGTSLRAWLFVIMKNTYINNYRKVKLIHTKVKLLSDSEKSKVLPQFTVCNTGEHKFIGKDIETALNTLPAILYLPFKMFVSGYKYHEIAKQMGVPVGTIKTRIHKGRQNLKIALKEYQYEH